MHKSGRFLVIIGAVLLSLQGAWGGVDADLIFHRVIATRAAEQGRILLTLEGRDPFVLSSDETFLLAERTNPRSLRSTEFVSVAHAPGQKAPLWLLAGSDTQQVEQLRKAVEVRSPAAKRIGEIQTCSLDTPCPKCKQWAEGIAAKQADFPPTLRVRAETTAKIQPGQLLIAADLLLEKRPLVVLSDEQTGATVNEIRSRERLLEGPFSPLKGPTPVQQRTP